MYRSKTFQDEEGIFLSSYLKTKKPFLSPNRVQNYDPDPTLPNFSNGFFII
jgi:hypothetical protein